MSERLLWTMAYHEEHEASFYVETREDAVKYFMQHYMQQHYPKWVCLTSVMCGGNTSLVTAHCDACNEPIFDDEPNVGCNGCDLHERCVEGSKEETP